MEFNGKQWELTFEDNFDGDTLDTTKWEKCPEEPRANVGGWWSDDMTSLDGKGNLILTASLREDGTPISGAVRTRGRFEQAYGLFECRCKLQRTTGFWCAFWLWCIGAGRVNENGAVGGAEIDIMESGDFKDSGVSHAIHWDGYGAEHKSVVQRLYDASRYEGYHTYALEWTKDAYIFYIDGVETWRTDEPGICGVPCYVKLSCEFGTWAGDIVPEELPDCMTVDYVRVYREVEE